MREGCPTAEVLRAFALGDLDENEAVGVAGHLQACPSCADSVARLDGMADPVLEDLRRRLGHTWHLSAHAAGDATLRVPFPPEGEWGPPDQLGEFRIVREVGRGGMGIVYEAHQGSLNRHVAVKLLREPADLARFRREAKAAGRLHHTNIVPVHGVGEHEGRHFYVMQYIAGRGLDEVLRGRRRRADERGGAAAPSADFREVARIVLQAAEAVAYAHDQGIVHRDIKPSNLLLDERGTVWITDFGLA
jgi:serine/threonine protein kinase